MKIKNLIIWSIVGILLTACTSASENNPRITEDFNFNWKFFQGDVENGQSTDLSDATWKEVRLPHDWSVENSFTRENTAGSTGFLPGGIGWYRKSFKMPADAKGKVIWIEFDGVYSNSEVWINGHYLGKRPYGYIPFKYDLTEYLKYGESNQIAVKVDRSAYIDCRWYPGSGIYRNVKLVTADKVHIPQWGTFVTTPEVSKETATVLVQTEVFNQYELAKTVIVRSLVFYNENEVAGKQSEVVLIPGESKITEQNIEIINPRLWDIESPNLYKVVSEILVDNQLIDSKETPFGIRSFNFDKDKGFFLNGRNLKLKGVCLHHDGGLVGAAVPIGVWERRLKTLKEGGCNAIRTAHNPPSEEFLDLCDRMGFLVQDEAFDEWNNPKDKKHNYNQIEADQLTRGYTEHFTEWSERDIKSMVLRDRNHPSIIMWSIGNEIEWTYPEYGQATGYWGENKVGDVDYYWDEPPFSVEQIKKNFYESKHGEYNLAETAKNLSRWVKEADTSRPVTANLVIPSVSNFSGYAEALDVVGLSYRQVVYDYCKRNYPDMVFLGTENWARFNEWQPVLEKEFISGIFLWTGINYMGESRNWPVKGSSSGILDFAGFEKPSFHMFKALWSSSPHIYITTQTVEKSPYKWDQKTNRLIVKEDNWAARQTWGWQDVNEYWNYNEGDTIAVEVYTNQSEVELFLDGKSLGTQKLEDVNDHILKWLVPYSSGKLSARSVANAGVEYSVQTAGEFANIQLRADKTELAANAYDVSHFTIQLMDANGLPVHHDNKEVVFEIDGDVRLLGVDNGSPSNVQDYQNNRILTSNGKALMILQSNLNSGIIKVKAVSGDVESETIQIKID